MRDGGSTRPGGFFSPVGLYFSTDLSCLSGLRKKPPPHAYTPTRDSTGAVRGTSDKATRNRRGLSFLFPSSFERICFFRTIQSTSTAMSAPNFSWRVGTGATRGEKINRPNIYQDVGRLSLAHSKRAGPMLYMTEHRGRHSNNSQKSTPTHGFSSCFRMEGREVSGFWDEKQAWASRKQIRHRLPFSQPVCFFFFYTVSPMLLLPASSHTQRAGKVHRIRRQAVQGHNK